MENAGLVGLSRQIALQRELDVVANNIANLNTTGYKADNVTFGEYVMPVARANQFRGSDRNVSFTQDRATWLDQSQGPIQHTGNPLDIAINGNAFLTVDTPRGERYTRNGALQVNLAGELVTSEGLRVVGQNGPIVLQNGDRDVSISSDGTVSVREGRNTTDSQRGKLKFASFADPRLLQKDGTSTFMPVNGMQAEAPTTVRINQGSIEKSNVNSVIEMTRMVEVTRTYTQVAQLLQQHSDMRRTAIQQLAEVPA
jgi:flagellar basal-body rod protein FlgF